ncbi:MAG: peptidylprolyl isomerase [Saprospiraceae bacterium]|nr:peptidylprolyl isomerase [Saprospiraceae bacterium]
MATKILEMKNRIVIALFCIAFIVLNKACVPPEYNRSQFSGIAVDFADKKVQDIYNLVSRQSVDTLMRYLRHENPTYRYITATAFGSLKDKKTVDSLAHLLKDVDFEVRSAAAYSLGQIGDERAEPYLLSAFERLDTTGKFSKLNGTILEAIGKCGSRNRLTDLCNITTFKMTDTTLIEGQMYGIYRFGQRDTFSGESIKKMVKTVDNKLYPRSTRVIAANYLARLKTKFDTSVTNPIGKMVVTERDADIRMALTKALSKAYTPLSIFPILESLFRQETDPRVKINLISALNDVDYRVSQPIILAALRDKNPHIANAAAQYCTQFGAGSGGQLYKNMSSDPTYAPSTRRILQGAALRHLAYYPRTRDSLNIAMVAAYKAAVTPYEKAEILRGLANFGYNFRLFRDEALNVANAAVVRSTAADCLAKVATAPDFYRQFKNYTIGIKNQLKTALFECVRTADAGVSAIAAEALVDPKAEYKLLLMKDSIPVIYEAMQRLKLPEQLEAYDALYKAITVIDPATDIKKKKTSNPRATDWITLQSLSPNATAVIKTLRGTIKMQLLTNNAPISVANFVTLARSGFFNGKIFHRVVPNFVIQTGCQRGDGYGSLDFTIPSELTPMHYNAEGMVGMASAGNHTECSQWFITHSPTPHLDPNYTIFAKVVEGMNVVQMMELGDAIESITIN